MYNNYILFLLVLLFILVLIALLNYKIIIMVVISIELCWLFFFFFNIYVNAFFENPILNYLNIWVLCFSTFEVVVIVLILNYLNK